MKITSGATRTVILTKRFAIKLPIFVRLTDAGAIARHDRVTWWMFKAGFRANRRERRCSRLNHPKLCPVLFADPFGFMVVMPRCSPMAPTKSWRESLGCRAICPVEYEYLVAQGLPIDNYHFNFGFLEGRLVSFNYGTPYDLRALQS